MENAGNISSKIEDNRRKVDTETEMFRKINQGIHSTQINTINIININKDQYHKIHNHAQNVVSKDTMQKFVVD